MASSKKSEIRHEDSDDDEVLETIQRLNSDPFQNIVHDSYLVFTSKANNNTRYKTKSGKYLTTSQSFWEYLKNKTFPKYLSRDPTGMVFALTTT